MPSNDPHVFRSGFVAIVGRPNVGKSTMLNAIVGRKVSIVSDKPQTTRTQVRGVRTTGDSQLVFLDTPGLHRPRTLLGERGNERALATLEEVDVVCFVIEANAPIGPGDRFVAGRLAEVDTPVVLALNKIDAATHDEIGEHLALASGELGDFAAYVPVSARGGIGLDALVAEFTARLPEGPHYYPDDVVADQPESFLVAELLREQLLKVAREELPHSIAVNTDDLEERRTSSGEPLLAVRVTVRVERQSQKGVVIGKGGEVLKAAGTAARRELEALLGVRVHLETRVKVEPDWQRRAGSLDHLGL
ncbi:MAG TPA: GTPase Era [Acidimicrobiia bacterium]|nr:GTPase Era [Acidimicrobiia bacterium]